MHINIMAELQNVILTVFINETNPILTLCFSLDNVTHCNDALLDYNNDNDTDKICLD